MAQRLPWVDYAKGIGIILVVYGHVARGLVNAGLVANPSFLRWLDGVIYGFHMPLFFLLAGLFFFESIEKRGAWRYVGGKLNTLVYPYMLWSLLQGGVEVLLSAYTNSRTTWSEVLALLWAPRAQFWFLYALFFCSVCAALLWVWVRWSRQGRAVVLVGAGLLALSLSPWMGGMAATRYVAGYFGFFALGVLWSVVVRDGAGILRWLGLAVGLMVALQWARDAGLLTDGLWVVWLAAVAGSAAVMLMAEWLEERARQWGEAWVALAAATGGIFVTDLPDARVRWQWCTHRTAVWLGCAEPCVAFAGGLFGRAAGAVVAGAMVAGQRNGMVVCCAGKRVAWCPCG